MKRCLDKVEVELMNWLTRNAANWNASAARELGDSTLLVAMWKQVLRGVEKKIHTAQKRLAIGQRRTTTLRFDEGEVAAIKILLAAFTNAVVRVELNIPPLLVAGWATLCLSFEM